MTTRGRAWWNRVLRLSVFGFAVGCALAVFAGLIAVLAGSTEFRSAQVGAERSVFTVMGTYIIAGTWAGFFTGVALPVARKRWGAPLVGFLAALPVVYVILEQLEAGGAAPLRGTAHFWVWLAASLVLGGGGAWTVRATILSE